MSATEVLKRWGNLPRSEQHSASARKFAKMAGLKSILEVRTQAWLEENDIPFEYEAEKWVYAFKPAKYTPDFKVPGPTLECKGKLTRDVRRKLMAIATSNPERKIALIFEKPENKIERGSRTTYAEWAEKHGFLWSAVTPRKEWFQKKRGKKCDASS